MKNRLVCIANFAIVISATVFSCGCSARLEQESPSGDRADAVIEQTLGDENVEPETEAGSHIGRQWGSRAAETRTTRVGGLIPYNVNSDDIHEIPEDFFLNIDKSMTWNELISEIGEPSGLIGSGIVRCYWRIGEGTYAVEDPFGNGLSFTIWTAEN